MRKLLAFLRDCIPMTGGGLAAVIGATLLVLLPATSAQSLTFDVSYTINYKPPNPNCSETYLGDYTLEGTELGGTLRVYYLDPLRDSIDPIEIASLTHPPSPCNGSSTGTLRFALDVRDPSTTQIYVSFGGDITWQSPGPPQRPVYAFPERTDAVSVEPTVAALIPLGGERPPNPNLPLFAFASPGTNVGTLSVTVQPVTLIEVSIDIKPGNYPNSINLGSAGVIPVAILSTNDFSAPLKIDPETISLAGAKVKIVGKGSKYLCHSEDINGDALNDLVCQVETVDFLIVEGDSTAVLEAETFDGTPVRGEDSVRIVP